MPPKLPPYCPFFPGGDVGHLEEEPRGRWNVGLFFYFIVWYSGKRAGGRWGGFG